MATPNEFWRYCTPAKFLVSSSGLGTGFSVSRERGQIGTKTMNTVLQNKEMVSSANIDSFIASQRSSCSGKTMFEDAKNSATSSVGSLDDNHYVDHSQDPLEKRGMHLFPLLDSHFRALWNRDTGAVSDRQILDHVGVGEKLTFPQLVYRMLSEVGKNDWEHIVSWTRNGRAFIINDRETFVRDIIPG